MSDAIPVARLGAGYREGVLWHDGVSAFALGERSLPAAVDVAIVGAGYCGLSAARVLARAGRSVVVVDRDALGTGASTRNGGMVIPELKEGPEALGRRFGETGRRMYAQVNEAFDHVESLIADEAIDCDYDRAGQLYLAHNRAHVAPLQAMAAEHGERLGEPLHWVPPEELAAEIGSDSFCGGVVIERTGGLHPAKFHAGLARLAMAAGAAVHERTTATGLTRSGAGFTLTTERGTVAASDVIVATNAYTDGLVPWLRRRVVPVGSFIIATEVLPPELLASVSPTGRMMVDTKNFLFYWRPSPDGRLLFGGRRSLAPSTIPRARDFLFDAMLRVHPQLADAAVERAWGGNVAITVDRLPHAGRVPRGNGAGAWFATGCNGSGVALNTWLGTQLAEAVMGAPAPAFAEIPFPPVPLHPLRGAFLPVVGRWFLHQDRRP